MHMTRLPFQQWRSVMWLWAIYHTPFSNHARMVLSFDSNVFFECSQPLQPRAHYSVFPYGSFSNFA